MTDFIDDDDDNEETEVERPKPRVKPEPKPEPKPVTVDPQPILEPPTTPSARRGSNGGSSVDPSTLQKQNDQEVQELFQRGPAKVIPIRPQGQPQKAPPAPPGREVAPSKPPASQGRPRVTPGPPMGSTAVQQAAMEAQRAAMEAQRAALEEERALAEADSYEPRVPVRRRGSPMILLGVAAAALFGAVAWSMYETYSNDPEEEEEEDEDDGRLVIEPPPLKVPSIEPDVIEGEIVESDEEGAA